jgi:hypothetical protein
MMKDVSEKKPHSSSLLIVKEIAEIYLPLSQVHQAAVQLWNDLSFDCRLSQLFGKGFENNFTQFWMSRMAWYRAKSERQVTSVDLENARRCEDEFLLF